MTNRLRKFFQKQLIAISLARFDLLFIIADLSTFRLNIKPASFFVKPTELSIPQRVQKFLQNHSNQSLALLVDELSADALYKTDQLFYQRHNDRDFVLEAPFMQAPNYHHQKPILSLYQEVIIKDFPLFADQPMFFKNRLDTMSDMRLYAADLQILLDNTTDSRFVFPIQVDWIKTGKRELFLDSPTNFILTQNLSPTAQENLCRLFFYLLFEKSSFISTWDSIAVDSADRVNFLNFDALYSASPKLKKFALDSHSPVATLSQLKLYRAMRLLKDYCQDVDVATICSEYQNFPLEKAYMVTDERKDFLHLLQQNGFNYGFGKALPDQPPEQSFKFPHLSEKKPDSQSLKSSIYYWGPIVLVALILFLFYQE